MVKVTENVVESQSFCHAATPAQRNCTCSSVAINFVGRRHDADRGTLF